MQIQLGILPGLSVCSLDLVPFTILTFSRSLKHHHSWRQHLGKRTSWDLTKKNVKFLVIDFAQNFTNHSFQGSWRNHSLLLTNSWQSPCLLANKYHLENYPFCRQGESSITYLCALQKSTRNKQAIKVNLPKFIQRRLTKAALSYHQILKLTYTYTHTN